MNDIIKTEPLGLENLSATICAELAAGLADADGIKEKYELTDTQWAQLKSSKAFRNMLLEALKEWSGDLNAGKRITKKAEVMLEDSLPILYEIANDVEKPSQQRIDSVKQMSVLAGRTAKESADAKGAGTGAAQINIIIDTGENEPKTVTIDAKALPPVDEVA